MKFKASFLTRSSAGRKAFPPAFKHPRSNVFITQMRAKQYVFQMHPLSGVDLHLQSIVGNKAHYAGFVIRKHRETFMPLVRFPGLRRAREGGAKQL